MKSKYKVNLTYLVEIVVKSFGCGVTKEMVASRIFVLVDEAEDFSGLCDDVYRVLEWMASQDELWTAKQKGYDKPVHYYVPGWRVHNSEGQK